MKLLFFGILIKLKVFFVYPIRMLSRFAILTKKKVKSSLEKIADSIPVQVSRLWQMFYRTKNIVSHSVSKHRIWFEFTILILAILLCWFFYSDIDGAIGVFFNDKTQVENLQTVFLSIGGALLGATAIAFSLIMFAMQVNVERMPFGLFKSFSSDFSLLSFFGITFILAISVTLLSFVPDKSWATVTILLASSFVILILALLLKAYKRALNLISPIQQLRFISQDAERNLNLWLRMSVRARPIIVRNAEAEESKASFSSHDIPRFTYFKLNAGWDQNTRNNISHCISYTKRFAEVGDHEVSRVALEALVKINAKYIQIKGKTFFNNNPLLENPYSSDGVFNFTLENLRQCLQIAVSREDEQHIEQLLYTFKHLCELYSLIDYSNPNDSSKSHANLAASYLISGVEDVVPKAMTDVLMEGVRLIGEAANIIAVRGDVNDTSILVEKLTLISSIGALEKKHSPLLAVGIRQISSLTFNLLCSEEYDIKFAVEKIRTNLKAVATLLLHQKETSTLSTEHKHGLSPYYSSTTTDSLTAALTNLTNNVCNASESDEQAKNIIQHIEQWSGGLYDTDKEILLLAVEKKSSLTFDIVHWITHITKLLLVLSNARVCEIHDRDGLRHNAIFLISVFSFLPDSEENAKYLEHYQLSEYLFEVAVTAHKNECIDIAIKIRNLLLDWTFKAGKYETGWGTLEHCCYGLACLNIILQVDNDILYSLISREVSKEEAPSPAIRARAASKIREKIEGYRRGSNLRQIDAAMASLDQERLRTILLGVADRLSPEQLEVD